MSNTDERTRGRWTTSLLVIAAFVVGIVLGTRIDASSIVSKYSQVGVAFFVGIVVALVILAVLAFVLRQVWKRDASPGLKQVWDGVSRDPNRATTLRYWMDEGLPALAPPARAVLAKLGLAAALGALTAIVANMILLATLVVSQLQADRLLDQNQLLATSNAVTLLQARSALDLELAKRQYDEINRILSSSTSVVEQISALEQLPETMVIPVLRVNLDRSYTPQLSPDGKTPLFEPIYPNMKPLRNLLVAYIRDERRTGEVPTNTAALRQADRVLTEAELDRVSPLSTAILICLHRLGRSAGPGSSVWEAANNLKPDAESLNEMLKVKDAPDDSNELDLLHLTNELRGAHLSGALRGRENGARFSPGTDLSQAQLQAANFHKSQLQKANLSGAQLREAVLSYAQLQGANLSRSKFHGGSLEGAQLSGADLKNAQFQAANLLSAELQGADLQSAQLQGANLAKAELIGANLCSAKLQGARCRAAKFNGANLRFAQLQGATFSSAQLNGADLENAELSGADLTYAEIESTNFCGADFGYARVAARRIEQIAGERTIFWYDFSPSSDAAFDQILDLPAALLDSCALGTASIRFKREGSTQNLVSEQWHIKDGRDSDFFRDRFPAIRWSRSEAAVDSLGPILLALYSEMEELKKVLEKKPSFPGIFSPERNKIAESKEFRRFLCDHFVIEGVSDSKPTDFTEAEMFGVFINSSSLEEFLHTDSVPPPREVFANAIFDEERTHFEFEDDGSVSVRSSNKSIWLMGIDSPVEYFSDIVEQRKKWRLGDPWPPPSASAPASQPARAD